MSQTVLIVDDSLTVRMDLDQAFRDSGFVTKLCADVAGVREVLATASFDIAVLDVLLPDGDGLDLLQELKSRADALPVMLLSSEAEVRDRIRGIRTGADEYVGKPYDAAYVVARARELLRARADSPEVRPILVIDDSATLRAELKSLLVSSGFTVLDVATGEEGLRYVADRRPRAVIVDGVLPGIDGTTVIRRIRSDATMRGTPCVLLTGSEEHGDEGRALDAGADAYVRKDADLSLVVARLQALLRGSDGALHSPASSLLGPKKILAVDDDETFLRGVADELRADGYEVAQARSGEEALALLEVDTVDAILLEVTLPGISGEETCRRIKGTARLREIPLVMLTSREERSAMIAGMNAGADDYIPKSSPMEVVKARLRAQLRRKQFEDENRHYRNEVMRKEIEATEARAERALAETRAVLLADLEKKNDELALANAELAYANSELEAFSYSVSHDLRSPLRAVGGFSLALLEDCGSMLDEDAKEYLHQIQSASTRMNELVDDLLELSRMSRGDVRREEVDLSELAAGIASELRAAHPDRSVDVRIQAGLRAFADPGLVRAVLQNLLGNSWKFTSTRATPVIEFGAVEEGDELYFFVRDNGVGFDSAYAHKLFGPFQRLHGDDEFEGTGIGLAIVYRVARRHGGKVRAEGEVEHGATISFTLGPKATRGEGVEA